VESFREILSCEVWQNAASAESGGPAIEARRRYRIVIGGTPALLIDEHFRSTSLRPAPSLTPLFPTRLS
jgi:chorismate-pyruvate lyase